MFLNRLCRDRRITEDVHERAAEGNNKVLDHGGVDSSVLVAALLLVVSRIRLLLLIIIINIFFRVVRCSSDGRRSRASRWIRHGQFDPESTVIIEPLRSVAVERSHSAFDR
jgi:hypothetical protein